MKALIVDADTHTASLLRRGLVCEGFSVDLAQTTAAALKLADAEDYAVVILDTAAPEAGGFAVLRKIREAMECAAVLVVSSHAREHDVIEGLDGGADDYLLKPIRLAELLARIRAIRRRIDNVNRQKSRPSVLRAGPLELHLLRRQLRKHGKTILLTQTEFSILECLMRRPGHVVSRPILLESLAFRAVSSETNVLDVHIKNLRAKIDGRSAPSLIRTVRGLGYAVES